MKVLLVAGARPNFMKVAPILDELRRTGEESILVHTGQHYDPALSDTFFRDLGMPTPDHHLGVGSGSHAVQTARIMEAFEPVLLSERPDWVVVVGDVNSTIACALVAAKLEQETGSRIAHVEAGLRSLDWRMPEEVNRVLTDRLSHLLLIPSPDARQNLLAEGIPDERIVFVGNVMIDALLAHLERARASRVHERFDLNRDYVMVTLHRPSNVDDPNALAVIIDALDAIAEGQAVLWPVHPRTRARLQDFGLEHRARRLKMIDPIGYIDMLGLVDGAAAVLTDSGGLQEETTALGVPCLTLREQTERPVTVTHGTNRLAPWPLDVQGILSAFSDTVSRGRAAVGERCPAGWDGRAACRIVESLQLRQRVPADLARQNGAAPAVTPS
jgi:UDP-N-acetylglucosamine 2-epimerase (non-hydrolysing)